jgi:phosphoribosylamine--glycine ligase
MTGEMGTVVTYDRSQAFFERTLFRLEPMLRDNGYCGYININTIVNAHGIWPLEFTCRFGYPGFAILDPLQETSWGDLFRMLVRQSGDRFATRRGFCVGVVLTTPPFPYTRHEVAAPIGQPVLFDGLTAADLKNLHYGEVGLENGQLVTTGVYGWTMVVTGVSDQIRVAQRHAYDLAARVFAPNLRYRGDIGDRLIATQYGELAKLHVFDRERNADSDAELSAIPREASSAAG